MSINITSTYVRDSDNFLTSAIGEETVVMNMSNGNYVGLNTVASQIWTLLEKPTTLQDIVKALTKMYDVSEQECQSESEECMSKLLEQQMILEYTQK